MRLTRSTIRSRFNLAVLTAGILVFASNCTLGPLQAFLFHFFVDNQITAGTTEEIHKAFYPIDVTLKKYFVRISGRLDTHGETPPNRITVTIAGEDQVTGKRNQKITLKLTLREDGSFTATKKIKKNIPAGTIQTISANPTGADIPAGSEVWACIDIAEKKADLAPASDCHGRTAVDIQIVEIVDDAFVPKSVTIEPGVTVRWVLRGNRSNHTTTEMSATWDSGFAFSHNGDFFEHTFGSDTEDKTFMYSCVTHKACCEMQGSISVGENAPGPDDGY